MISPNVKIIDSAISTSSSSNSTPKVLMVTLPDVALGGITIDVELTSYSSGSASPDKVKGTVISVPDAMSEVAVNVTLYSEFSSIDSDDSSKVTNGGLSSSIIDSTNCSLEMTVFSASPGVTIIVSSASKELS